MLVQLSEMHRAGGVNFAINKTKRGRTLCYIYFLFYFCFVIDVSLITISIFRMLLNLFGGAFLRQ